MMGTPADCSRLSAPRVAKLSRTARRREKLMSAQLESMPERCRLIRVDVVAAGGLALGKTACASDTARGEPGVRRSLAAAAWSCFGPAKAGRSPGRSPISSACSPATTCCGRCATRWASRAACATCRGCSPRPSSSCSPRCRCSARWWRGCRAGASSRWSTISSSLNIAIFWLLLTLRHRRGSTSRACSSSGSACSTCSRCRCSGRSWPTSTRPSRASGCSASSPPAARPARCSGRR